MLLKFHCLRLILPLACVLLLGGCSGMPADGRDQVEHARALHEQAMKEAWVGQPYEALKKKLGAPSMLMDIPYSSSSVAMYEGLDTASNCVDSFSLSSESANSVVNDYFCR